MNKYLSQLHETMGSGKLPFCKCSNSCCIKGIKILLYPIEKEFLKSKYLVCNKQGVDCNLETKPLLCKFYPFFPYIITNKGIKLKIAEECVISDNLSNVDVKNHINLVAKCTVTLYNAGLREFLLNINRGNKNIFTVKT